MADPANDSAAAVATATPPEAPSPASLQPPAPPSDDNPGGLTDRHWNDPDLGPRLRNWKTWADKKGDAAKAAEQKAATLEQTIQQINAVALRHPKLADQLRAALAGTYEEDETTPPPTDETETQRMRREIIEEVQAILRTEMATTMHLFQLGKGNLEEGRKVLSEHSPVLGEVIRIMNKGKPAERLQLAWELTQSRSASKTPPPSSAPPPVPPSEPGRGVADAAPVPEPQNDMERFSAVMRDAGYSGADGLANYMRDHGVIGG